MVERNYNRVIFAGSQGWALHSLLQAFHRAREVCPALEFHAFVSDEVTDDPKSSHGFRKALENCKTLLQKPGVSVFPAMEPDEAADHFSAAGMWCYPAHMPYVESNAARWAQTCGAIPIYCPVGMLISDVYAGFPIWGLAALDKLVQCRYTARMLMLALNPGLQDEIRKPMMEKAQETPWTMDPLTLGRIVAKARKIQGWMTESELEWLAEAASRVDSVTEIGSWKGRSTTALVGGCKGTVTAVDHWQGGKDEPDHILEMARHNDLYGEFARNMGGPDNLQVIKAASQSAVSFADDSDMVFIDGGHGYDEVRLDIRAWLPKTKKLICGHDFNWPSVKRAVLEELGPGVRQGSGAIWFKVLQPAKEESYADAAD